MKPTALLSTLALSLALALGGTPAAAAEPTASAPTVQIQQVRNATLKREYAGRTLLVDPMLGASGAYPGCKRTHNQQLRNPLVELPTPAAEVRRGADAVGGTQPHLDHRAGGEPALVPKDHPILVHDQADPDQARGQSYPDVRVIDGRAEFEGVRLTRTGGRHGSDAMFAVEPVAGLLGQAMGVVFQAPGAATVYVVGDTTWHGEVEQALAAFKPDVVVLNTGDARVPGFTGSIIMGRDDVLRAARAAPGAVIVATHMDAINHMTLSREVLRDHVRQNGLEDRVRVPADGETMAF